MAVQWHTAGRHLKNKVSNPLEVQNPEFTEDGLYSVHAGIVLEIGGQMALLRSNEQLVAFGGSKTMPKQTLWAALGRGRGAKNSDARHGVATEGCDWRSLPDSHR